MVFVRLALASLSPSRLLWGILFVLVPLGLLLASLWISEQFANGIVGICGFLALVLWATSYYNYNRYDIRIDPTSRTLTIHQRNANVERTVDLARVDSISVQPLGTTAIVRIEESSLSWLQRFTLYPLAVPTEYLQTALETLEASGVDVRDSRSADTGDHERRSLETRLRLLATPLVLIGVPLAALFLFGQSVLYTNGAALVMLLALSAAVQEFRAARA